MATTANQINSNNNNNSYHCSEPISFETSRFEMRKFLLMIYNDFCLENLQCTLHMHSQSQIENKTFFQGELLYGYGGREVYQYSIFKPLEGYF